MQAAGGQGSYLQTASGQRILDRPAAEVGVLKPLTDDAPVVEVPLPPEQVSIETRIEQLLERLSETEACGFEDLFQDAATRGDMIVTFLARDRMLAS